MDNKMYSYYARVVLWLNMANSLNIAETALYWVYLC